jgi:hypothetical protein
VDYEKFVEAIRKLGLFICVVQVPMLNEEKSNDYQTTTTTKV